METEGKDIIVTDEDTQEEDQYENSVYPDGDDQDYDNFEVDISETPFTVFELNRQREKNNIVLNPDFQRNLVWKQEQDSRFVESIILNYPLMPFYMNRDKQGRYIVVDGIQRISAVTNFIKDKYPLKGLDTLTRLNGKKFSELPELLRTRIEDRKLICHVIKASVKLSVIYDIFKRINSGGTQLNRQEIRNCIHLGKATELLKRLAQNAFFIKTIDGGISPLRMKDQEAVLRYLAFRIQGFEDAYKGDMDSFLGQTMDLINGMDDAQIESLASDFDRVMMWCSNFFDKDSFRIPSENHRGRVNVAVMEAVCLFISEQKDANLETNQNRIIANYDRLIHDSIFMDAVQNATSGRTRVRSRFERAKTILGDNSC